MTLAKFIKKHRVLIDSCIRRAYPGSKIDNNERELWVNNDEGLYIQAKNAGVDFEKEGF